MSEHELYDEADIDFAIDNCISCEGNGSLPSGVSYMGMSEMVGCEDCWPFRVARSEHSLRLEAEARVRQLEKVAARAMVVIEANDAAERGQGRPWAGRDAREALRSALAALETGGE